MLVVIEPTTPLNNADQGGSFYFSGEMQQVDPEKDQVKVKPPKTYKERIRLFGVFTFPKKKRR